MSGNKLFLTRLIGEYRYQWRVLHTVLDWSVMLYIAIPAAVILPFAYADFWRNIHLYWDARLPVQIVLILLLILSGYGNIRTYLFDADLLFLIQRRKVIRQLKRDSFLSSLLALSLVEAVLLFAALPVLVGIYRYTVPLILSLFLVVSAYKLMSMTIRKAAGHAVIRWLLRVVSFSLTGMVLTTASFQLWIVFGGIVWLLMLWLNVRRFTEINDWARELENEYGMHTRLIRVILRYTGEVPKPQTRSSRKPLLFFRKSGRIFKQRSEENGLLEFLLKSVLRNKKHLSLYYKLIGVTCIAVLFLPFWLKWTIFFLFIWFINRWLGTLFLDLTVNDFFVLVPFRSENAERACQRFQRWLGVPPDILVGITTALSTLTALR
jgi:Predicted ABC-type exoprotein transport system, permease component